MCGIVGYVGEEECREVLLSGIEKLEYRGYDSSGICFQQEGSLLSRKEAGRIRMLRESLEVDPINGTAGIAHTRWATHGEPSKRNAHPHLSMHKSVAIVHNGIIENYHALKQLLEQEGITFSSDTDSELLAHYIEKFYEGDLETAVRKTLVLVEGAFGLAVMHKDHHEIVVARRGSPLIVGIGENCMYVASDVTAILEFTKDVIYMKDDEIATLKPHGYAISTLEGTRVVADVQTIQWSVEQLQKGNYKHFMLKEIYEQPQSFENTLRGRITDGKIKLTVTIPKEIKRIVIVACGTASYAGLIGRYYLEKFTGIPVEVDYASEFRYRDPIVGKGDLVIAVSQSGETADTLAAIQEAKRKGALTLGVVNVVGSTIAREVESGIYVHAGPEIGVASTKAFTCQVTGLLLLALYIRQKQGHPLDKELLAELETIPQKMKEVLEQEERIKEIAHQYMDRKNFLYLGRGVNYATALEGSLKLKELSYIHAEGCPAAEMKHGHIALIDEDMPVFFVAPKDHTYEKILSNMQEIHARKGRILAVLNEEDDAVAELAETMIVVPKCREELTPLLMTLPLQLFAYHVADLRGLNVDKPRNLAKSVTVE